VWTRIHAGGLGRRVSRRDALIITDAVQLLGGYVFTGDFLDSG
jgi:hypothetical protein